MSALELARHLGVLPKIGEDTAIKKNSEHELLEAIYDPEQPGSLAGNIRNLMWSAACSRASFAGPLAFTESPATLSTERTQSASDADRGDRLPRPGSERLLVADRLCDGQHDA